METNDTNILLEKKATFFMKEHKLVHITLKKNNKFYNGVIVEVSSDFIMFDDRFIGTFPIFYLEIESIEPFELKKELRGDKPDGAI